VVCCRKGGLKQALQYDAVKQVCCKEAKQCYAGASEVCCKEAQQYYAAVSEVCCQEAEQCLETRLLCALAPGWACIMSKHPSSAAGHASWQTSFT